MKAKLRCIKAVGAVEREALSEVRLRTIYFNKGFAEKICY